MTPRTGVTRKPVLARPGELGVTFIGHSSFFLQIGGKNILVDPNFARWIFVLKRLRRPGLSLRDLPPIDAVLVTHAHFDHLHRPSLRAIARLTRWHRQTADDHRAPPGSRPGQRSGIWPHCRAGLVAELRLGHLEITHVPARHWGARMVRDMHRGYGGYVLKAGDHRSITRATRHTSTGFREIGERLRPEVALLPIGAYHPASYRSVHTSPEDAVQAFVDLGARWMVPMHYGTFRLSHEPVDEPLQRLKLEAKRRTHREEDLRAGRGRDQALLSDRWPVISGQCVSSLCRQLAY